MSSRARSGSAAAALDDLDEAGVVGIAVDVDHHADAVAEGGLSGENLGGLRPPLTLLRSVAVSSGRLFGLEAGERDESTVISHTRGAAEPARRAGRQLLHPTVERGVSLFRVGYLPLNHLDEHVELPSPHLLGCTVSGSPFGRYSGTRRASIPRTWRTRPEVPVFAAADVHEVLRWLATWSPAGTVEQRVRRRTR